MLNIRPPAKRKYFLTVIACLTLFVSLISFSTGKTGELAHDVISQTNKFRRSKGLPDLKMREDLNGIAQKHSADMARGRVGLGHSGFKKRNAMVNAKLKYAGGFAENVAYGASSAREVMTMWKNSPGHRRNLLGPYKYIGIGLSKDNKGRIYYTLIFAG